MRQFTLLAAATKKPTRRERHVKSLRSLTVGLVCLLLAPSAFGAMVLIDWTSINGGSGGGVTATVVSTVNAGTFDTGDIGGSEPAFVAEYSSTLSTLFYRSIIGGGAGDILSTITFSSALPAGSQLLVIDADVRDETATLASGGNPLTLLAQVESNAGVTSTFPTYNAVLGELVAFGLENSNDASIFDLSGASSVQVDFTGGGLGSRIFVAVALPIPVPGMLYAMPLALTIIGVRRR